MTQNSEQPFQSDLLTIPLGAVRLKHLSSVGGKAAHLGELIAAGLPVPSGFVVKADACTLFVKSDPRVADGLKQLEQCNGRRDPAALRAVAEQVRQQLGMIPMPGAVANAIAMAMASEPPGGAWAVRSSATAEDLPEASFAGQHDSFLNVRGGDAVMAAVKRCWVSLFSDRAVSYRLRKGIASGHAQMAVIVQQLVSADASGVMFTSDPAGGNDDCILIEAAFGLGESVVQGKVTPDRLEVSRSELRVVRREPGLKRLQVVPAPDGVREEPLAGEKSAAPALDDAMAAGLARLGLETERVLGGSLDIEWGLRGGTIWLLQARPVTVLQPASKSGFEASQIWTNANAGEVLPDVVTPMTWSLVRQFVHYLFDNCFRQFGIQIEDEQLLGLLAGRAYFNCNTACALARLVPGMEGRAMELLFGGHQDAWASLKRVKLSEARLPRLGIRRGRLAISLPIAAIRLLFSSTRRAPAAVDKVRRLNEDLARLQPKLMSDGELVAAIGTFFIPEVVDRLGAIEAVGFAAVYYSALFGLCHRWFGPEGRGIANRLLASVGDMDDAAAGYELWLLAEQAARAPEIKAILAGERTFAGFASRVGGCPGGRPFLDRWNTFMHQHGHHTRGEIELFNARWSECPDFVLDILRSYVAGIDAGQPSPILRRDALARERATLERHCLSRLSNPCQRAVMRIVIRRAQTGGRIRENLKSGLVRWLTLLRGLLLELGSRLAIGGRLADASDIFFMEMRELDSRLWDRTTDLRVLVAPRRAQYEKHVKITPPAVIVGRFDPDALEPEMVDREKRVFYGMGVSAGIITGRARVILRSDTAERIQPGEILVAPFTDPGWTPYFVAAAGIVMDMGGLLSHGSIVAREYGIPAVVNVGAATQILRSGQRLEVDADRGVVKVLE